MTRQECVKALQQTAEAAGFITMGEIKRFTGIKRQNTRRSMSKGWISSAASIISYRMSLA